MKLLLGQNLTSYWDTFFAHNFCLFSLFLGFCQPTHWPYILVQPPPDPKEPTKKRVLKGISFLSLDFGRLSAENLELRSALKQAQLECRQLHERCGRKIQLTNVPICLDNSVQTELDSNSSGATTPSIPSDPLTINEDLQLLAMRRELQMLSEENVSS
jgi:hypothetical protein